MAYICKTTISKMKARFYVLGTGESIKDYSPCVGSKSIGVNDASRYVHCDYIVCLDPIRLFSDERLSHITKSKPEKFFSFLPEWEPIVSNFELIQLQSPRGDLSKLDGDNVCYSNNSPFAACVMAYKLGAKEIVMYGVDFNSHQAFKDKEKKERIMQDYSRLYLELKNRGVKLFVGTDKSYLSEFIPMLK